MSVEPVVRVLQSRGAPYALIGAHAMAARGYPRFTIDVDLILAKWAWESEVINRSEPMSVAGVSIPVPRTGDLVLLKLAAGGFIDLQDAAALLALDGTEQVVRDVETHIHRVRPDVSSPWRGLLEGRRR